MASRVLVALRVPAAPQRAFDAFVMDFARWWPLSSHHVGSAAAAVDCVIEPRAGGSIFERDAAGKETIWASVLAYEPPERPFPGVALSKYARLVSSAAEGAVTR